MARIDERTRRMLEDFSQQMEEVFGDDLRAVVLYGSAAGLYFLPGISDVNVLVVLKGVTPQQLRQLTHSLKRFQRGRLAPLFLATDQLKALAESYPIELLELKEQHRLLHGEDVFADLKISTEKIRSQLIGELLGKLLLMRSLYLEISGDARRLEEVLGQVVSPLGALMRAMLRLRDEKHPPPREFLEVVTQIEERLGLELWGLRDAYQVRTGLKRLERKELETLFERLLREVEELSGRAQELSEWKISRSRS